MIFKEIKELWCYGKKKLLKKHSSVFYDGDDLILIIFNVHNREDLKIRNKVKLLYTDGSISDFLYLEMLSWSANNIGDSIYGLTTIYLTHSMPDSYNGYYD